MSALVEPPPPKLLDRLRHACRVRHYSIRTEDAHHDWAKRFILFHIIGRAWAGARAGARAPSEYLSGVRLVSMADRGAVRAVRVAAVVRGGSES